MLLIPASDPGLEKFVINERRWLSGADKTVAGAERDMTSESRSYIDCCQFTTHPYPQYRESIDCVLKIAAHIPPPPPT